MKKIMLLIILSLIALSGYSQSTDLPDRAAFKLKLAVNDTDFYEANIKEAPYVLKNNTIQIYPGDKIFIEMEVIDKEIKSLKSVKTNINPEKTVTITFSQVAEGRKHQQMILNVQNPFAFNLSYSAAMFLLKQKRWIKTDVLPVRAKIGSYETWSDIIVTMALSDWKLQ
jgi:hypothetical protein